MQTPDAIMCPSAKRPFMATVCLHCNHAEAQAALVRQDIAVQVDCLPQEGEVFAVQQAYHEGPHGSLDIGHYLHLVGQSCCQNMRSNAHARY